MQPSSRLAAAVLAAAGVGAGLGALARAGKTSSGPERPDAVEALLRAVDKGDAAALARAVSDTGPAAGYASPWREEVEMASLVAAGDAEALWRFAASPPAGAARARALLWLRARARTPEERARAGARLAADYPSSWALLPGAERAGGGPR